MMSSRARSLLALFALSAVVAGCGSEDSASSGFNDPAAAKNGAPPPAQQPGQNASNGSANEASRAIAEADIIQLSGDRLYAMSKSGTLTVIDVSQPAQLKMLGQAYLPGEPFEMYLKGDLLIAMTNGTYSTTGTVNEPAPAGSSSVPSVARDRSSGAGVIAINVKDPGLMQRVTTYAVPGEIADSRMVGDVLYLATYENSSCYRCTNGLRTMVTSFNVANATSINVVDQVAFSGGTTGNQNGWQTWKRSIFANAERIYVGGHIDSSPNGTADEGVIDVIDITDPTGKLAKGASLTTLGAVTSRWQMDEYQGVLRVVTQRGADYTRTGIGNPKVQMFHMWNPRSYQLMGSTDIRMPVQEGLKAVRFDGERAYAITFRETDPLFIIDLANEAAPKQRGELEMPGWVFHLEPRGNRLLGLGLDRRDASGNLNVSLFDVADMDNPRMLQRVSFGPRGGTDAQIVSYELPEDQDRIQKAFRVLENNLIVVPFTGSFVGAGGVTTTTTTSSCSISGGIQLIDWQQDSLVKQSTLPMTGNPRRALLHKEALIGVSDSNVSAFDVTRREAALKTADLTIGSCETRSVNGGGLPPQMPDDRAWANDTWRGGEGDSWGRYSCAAAPGRSSSTSFLAGIGVIFGLAAVARRRRH